MEVYNERTKETIKLEFNGSGKELLEKIHILVEDVLIIKNNSLVTEEEELTNDDQIKLLSVISGG
jgi:sulfur carrier protein ThiS